MAHMVRTKSGTPPAYANSQPSCALALSLSNDVQGAFYQEEHARAQHEGNEWPSHPKRRVCGKGLQRGISVTKQVRKRRQLCVWEWDGLDALAWNRLKRYEKAAYEDIERQ